MEETRRQSTTGNTDVPTSYNNGPKKKKKNKLENYPEHRTERNQIKWPVDRIRRLTDGQHVLGGFLFICSFYQKNSFHINESAAL